MSDRLYVSTRKGLFTLDRSGPDDWGVVRAAFLGDPVTMLLDDARDGTLHAALNLGHFGVKLRRSEDRGRTWQEVGTPAYPAEPEGQIDATPAAPSVHQIWSLAAAGDDRPGALWAGTIPGGLFHSPDRGESWVLNRALWDRPERDKWFGGGYDDPGIHSVCVDPRDSRRVTVGVSCGGVWVTPDAGETWECRADGMFAEYMPEEQREDPSVQDPQRIVQCPSSPDNLWAQHHNGVFRSTNGAERWTEVTAIRPSSFGFAVAVHPQRPDTAWFVPGVKDECRIPVDGRLVVARTRDGGRSFDVLRKGLPQEHAYDLVFRHALDVDTTGDRLAVGSTTGGLWISEDGGDRWHCVNAHLPPIYQVLFAGSA
jgi:hypothetical protein